MKVEIFDEIIENLKVSRTAFLAYDFVDESFEPRSIDEAKLIIDTFKAFALKLKDMLTDYPSLEQIYVKNFSEVKQLFDRESILEICFLDNFLFPDKEQMPLPNGSKIDEVLLINYQQSFNDWCEEVVSNHLKSQNLIKESFNLEIKPKDIECPCQKCLADYRAKLRDLIYLDLKDLVDKSVIELETQLINSTLFEVSELVSRLKKNIDRSLQKVRYRLKRGSLKKLDSDIKSYMKSQLGYSSPIGRVCKERLLSYFYSLMDEFEVSPDMISEEEFERFFLQLGMSIWKSPTFLKKEFEKFLQAIMAYKRKDISASILTEYLGKFWVYSTARSKKRKIIYHMGPTNSGKTYNAIEALAKAKHGCYLAPLRLLASELFDTLNDKGVTTSLLTGEEVIERTGATHYSSTIEMARMNDIFDCVVIDEIQMITDPQRGWAWTRALVNINSDEIHLCGDDSVLELVEKILKLTGDTLEVRKYERKTSLSVMQKTLRLVDLEKSDALIVFSRRNALKFKMDLERLDFKVSIVYGRLSPEVRREQARKFDEGETDIMVSTDAIAMGMNLPIKRIVFSTLTKYIDSKEQPISESEIKQIAGRAGRYKRFPEGYVSTLQQVEDGLDTIEKALSLKLSQKELAMVGPDLDIFRSVNKALIENGLKSLSLSEFLRLFNTMSFDRPFYCVDLKEMIEVTEMIEEVDEDKVLSDAEVFGFACAPVNLGMMEHVQYYVWIANHYVKSMSIVNEPIDVDSDDIDYLERAIKCVELYQWLARHFNNKNFNFSESDLLNNKSFAIERLNQLLSEKTAKRCSSCGCKLPDSFEFNICETCFNARRFNRRSPGRNDKFKRHSKPKENNSRNISTDHKNKRRSSFKSKNSSRKSKASAFKRG